MALGSTQPLTEMSTSSISWGVKAAGAWGWQPYHHPVPLSRNLGTLNSWNPLGLSRPVTGLIYLFTLLSLPALSETLWKRTVCHWKLWFETFSQRNKELLQEKKINSNVKPDRRIPVLHTTQKFPASRYNRDDISVMNMHGMPTYSSPILTEILNRYSKWLLNLKFPLRHLLDFQS